MSIQPGARLGHYEILSPLGKGGMGEVWRARDTKLRREVAIKTLPSELAHDPERVARLVREATSLAAVSHPNVAAIYGLEEHGELRFLVLELVDGDTLAERMLRKPLSVRQALEIALQIAEALETAHERGIVHRDLKPANIKVARDGRVKVLDFGLAKTLAPTEARGSTEVTAHTELGAVMGTAPYMSPEQVRAEASCGYHERLEHARRHAGWPLLRLRLASGDERPVRRRRARELNGRRRRATHLPEGLPRE